MSSWEQAATRHMVTTLCLELKTHDSSSVLALHITAEYYSTFLLQVLIHEIKKSTRNSGVYGFHSSEKVAFLEPMLNYNIK